MLPDVPPTARTVLHVDDDLSNLRLVEAILARRPGVRVMVAKSGTLALELALQHPPQLVLPDADLPDMSGDELLRRLRTDPRTSATPVVMTSAESTPAQIEHFLAAGAMGYLTKPFDISQLLQIVDSTPTSSETAVARDEPNDEDDNPLDLRIVGTLRSLYAAPHGSELSDLMTAFIQDVRGQTGRLRNAAALHDAESVERLAHDLRGSTGMYGARFLPELFGELERLGTSGNLAGAESLLQSIERELNRVEAAIRFEFATPQ